jgi:hypothetical protein
VITDHVDRSGNSGRVITGDVDVLEVTAESSGVTSLFRNNSRVTTGDVGVLEVTAE